jgi:hypothetical protein
VGNWRDPVTTMFILIVVANSYSIITGVIVPCLPGNSCSLNLHLVFASGANFIRYYLKKRPALPGEVCDIKSKTRYSKSIWGPVYYCSCIATLIIIAACVFNDSFINSHLTYLEFFARSSAVQ